MAGRCSWPGRENSDRALHPLAGASCSREFSASAPSGAEGPEPSDADGAPADATADGTPAEATADGTSDRTDATAS